MDNKRMFSAPLELLERACMLPSKESMSANHQGVIDRGRAQDELRALLAQPSTQQADPDRALKDALFACLAAGGDDRVYGGVATTGDRQGWVRFTAVAAGAQHQGEPVALPARKRVDSFCYDQGGNANADGWNACLEEIAKLGPLYTHPGAGEVDRLRAQIEHLQRELSSSEVCRKENYEGAYLLREERDTLRAQLAERDSVLKRQPSFFDALEKFEADDGTFVRLSDVLGAVAASAEPRAAADDLADADEPCRHEWTDDGAFLLVCTACGAQEDHDPHWRDMATAPRDGTMLRLLVAFEEHPTEDADEAPTIGSNNFDNDGEDRWQFAGWCWTHDHFTSGKGEPVGWLPMLDAPKTTAGQEPQCLTCNDEGAIGNILNAEPCPDCAAAPPEFERGSHEH